MRFLDFYLIIPFSFLFIGYYYYYHYHYHHHNCYDYCGIANKTGTIHLKVIT